MRLGLGTAQFGLDYGVSNERGKVPLEEVRQILELAASAGMSVLDTAPAYGESEAAIGRALAGPDGFRVVTKTPVSLSDAPPADKARLLAESFAQSQRLLRRNKLYGLLFHRAGDATNTALLDAALALTQTGRVQKIGVAVYSAAEIDRVLRVFTPGIVQVPVNVFDQRLVDSGHLAELKRLGVEIHVRSVFLQGLLLMSRDRLAGRFDRFRPHIERYFDAVEAAGCSKLQAALGFAATLDVDVVLAGVSCVGELREILSIGRSPALPNLPFGEFSSSDLELVDPSRWKMPERTTPA